MEGNCPPILAKIIIFGGDGLEGSLYNGGDIQQQVTHDIPVTRTKDTLCSDGK